MYEQVYDARMNKQQNSATRCAILKTEGGKPWLSVIAKGSTMD